MCEIHEVLSFERAWLYRAHTEAYSTAVTERFRTSPMRYLGQLSTWVASGEADAIDPVTSEALRRRFAGRDAP